MNFVPLLPLSSKNQRQIRFQPHGLPLERRPTTTTRADQLRKDSQPSSLIGRYLGDVRTPYDAVLVPSVLSRPSCSSIYCAIPISIWCSLSAPTFLYSTTICRLHIHGIEPLGWFTIYIVGGSVARMCRRGIHSPAPKPYVSPRTRLFINRAPLPPPPLLGISASDINGLINLTCSPR